MGDVGLGQLAEVVFVKFLHGESLLPPLSLLCSLEASCCEQSTPMEWGPPRRGDCFPSLRMEYLYKIFELVHDRLSLFLIKIFKLLGHLDDSDG